MNAIQIYELLISKEYITIRDIKQILKVGTSKATNIRKDAINYCDKHHIRRYTDSKIPKEAFFGVIGKDLEYFKKLVMHAVHANNLFQQMEVNTYACV